MMQLRWVGLTLQYREPIGSSPKNNPEWGEWVDVPRVEPADDLQAANDRIMAAAEEWRAEPDRPTLRARLRQQIHRELIEVREKALVKS